MYLPERKRVARSEIAVQGANMELRKAVAALMAVAGLTFLSTRASAATETQKQDPQYRQSLQDQKQLEKRLKQIRGRIAEYEERLRRNPNDPRLHYNRGTVAYEDHDYEKAEKELALGLSTPDLQLQQRAAYNLGNTLYRQGEQAAEVDQKIAAWEKAVQNFENATHLEPQDADAKFNLDLVKKRLEELKQQQPKQDKQQPNKQDDQQKDKEKQNQQEEKQKSDSSKQQDQQHQEKEQKSQQESKPQDQKSDQPPNEQQEKASNQKDARQEQAKQNKPEGAGKGDEKSGEQNEADAAPAPGQMTVKQAQQLLESTKGDERAMIFVPAQKFKERKRSFKDW